MEHFDLDQYEWTETRGAIADLREYLQCKLCHQLVVNPHTLGRCSHFFCRSCIEDHAGGVCPVADCGVSAPAKEMKPNCTLDQIVKSITVIGHHMLGEEIPDRLKNVENETEAPSAKKQKKQRVSKKAKKKEMQKVVEEQSPREEDMQADSNHGAAIETEDKEPQNKEDLEEPSFFGDINKKSSKKKQGPKNAEPKSSKKKQEPKNVEPKSSKKKQEPKNVEPKSSKKAQKNHSQVSDAPPKTNSKQKAAPKTKTKQNLNAIKGAWLIKKNKKGETALHSASVSGDLNEVKDLLKLGADPNTRDNAGWTPLHEAAGSGHLELVNVLLSAGASPCVPATSDNTTPLHDAASNGHAGIVAALVARGADPRARNSQGKTPADLTTDKDVLHALESTELEVTPSQALNQSVIDKANKSPEEFRIACPGAEESVMKKVADAAASIGAPRPSTVVTAETTHCLLEATAKRDFFYYQALVAGCSILTLDWAYQCQAAGMVVDEEPFVLAPEGASVEGQVRSVDRRHRRQPGLLAGSHVYLQGFEKAHSKKEFTNLIQAADGRVVNREPDPENLPLDEQTVMYHADPDSSLSCTSHIIVYQEGGRREPKLKYNMKHIKSLPASWLTESINHYKLIDPSVTF